MSERDWIEANRLAWDQVAPIHESYYFEQLLKAFSYPGFSCLGPNSTRLFQSMNYRGKAVAQPACNNGRELVSLKNIGASRCVGFDLSGAFIGQAKRLAEAARVECEFVECNMLSIPESYASSFDIVYISVGTLRWVPRLERFITAVASLLKPRGQLFVHEMHPILAMFAADSQDRQPCFQRSYFMDTPHISTQGLDYYGNTRYQALPTYHFSHKLSDIIGTMAENKLNITHFQEMPYDISRAYTGLEKSGVGLPMSYTLIADKAK